MTRRKGQRTPAQNEREFPLIVEMAVPPNGFGRKLDAMHAFHSERGLEARRGCGRRHAEQDFVRWCFANHEDAKFFAQTFGGVLVKDRRERP